jgi:hypothetical protein
MTFLKQQLLYAVLIVIPRAGYASLIEIDFSINTAPLASSLAGPFSVDFQFVDGSGIGDANNTVTIGDIGFGGGSALGAPALTGGATGSLSSGVSMVDNNFFNEFTQEFVPGTLLSFQATSTTNVDAGGVPDEFSFAILDSTGVEIPTEGLVSTGSDVFLNLNIDSPTTPSIASFASDPARAPAAGGGPIDTGPPDVTVTAVGTGTPEPATVFLSGVALALITLRKARRSPSNS